MFAANSAQVYQNGAALLTEYVGLDISGFADMADAALLDTAIALTSINTDMAYDAAVAAVAAAAANPAAVAAAGVGALAAIIYKVSRSPEDFGAILKRHGQGIVRVESDLVTFDVAGLAFLGLFCFGDSATKKSIKAGRTTDAFAAFFGDNNSATPSDPLLREAVTINKNVYASGRQNFGFLQDDGVRRCLQEVCNAAVQTIEKALAPGSTKPVAFWFDLTKRQTNTPLAATLGAMILAECHVRGLSSMSRNDFRLHVKAPEEPLEDVSWMAFTHFAEAYFPGKDVLFDLPAGLSDEEIQSLTNTMQAQAASPTKPAALYDAVWGDLEYGFAKRRKIEMAVVTDYDFTILSVNTSIATYPEASAVPAPTRSIWRPLSGFLNVFGASAVIGSMIAPVVTPPFANPTTAEYLQHNMVQAGVAASNAATAAATAGSSAAAATMAAASQAGSAVSRAASQAIATPIANATPTEVIQHRTVQAAGAVVNAGKAAFGVLYNPLDAAGAVMAAFRRAITAPAIV